MCGVGGWLKSQSGASGSYPGPQAGCGPGKPGRKGESGEGGMHATALHTIGCGPAHSCQQNVVEAPVRWSCGVTVQQLCGHRSSGQAGQAHGQLWLCDPPGHRPLPAASWVALGPGRASTISISCWPGPSASRWHFTRPGQGCSWLGPRGRTGFAIPASRGLPQSLLPTHGDNILCSQAAGRRVQPRLLPVSVSATLQAPSWESGWQPHLSLRLPG